jgi:hypothetical protein
MPFLGGGLRGPKGDTGDTGASGTTTIAQVVDLQSRSYFRDFATHKNLNDHGTGPSITFTRASDATYFDADGVLQTASNNVPRFDHSATGSSLGLLIEEARTNGIRNSQGGGSVNGVIPSVGNAPTNWFRSNIAGATYEVMGTGTTNGLAWVDVKISGTNSSGGSIFPAIGFESGGQITASTGQTWAASFYAATSGGSTSGIANIQVNIVENDSGGGFLTNGSANISITSSLARYSHVRTLSNASTARVTLLFTLVIANGNSFDITVRLAAPQLEQGAFPTSYIPTTTAAATRAADSAVVTPIASFYNQAEGTALAEYIFQAAVPSSSFPHIYSFNDGTDDNMVRLIGTATTNPFIVRVADTDQSSIGSSAIVAGTIYRNAGAYRQDDFAASRNGGAVGTDSSGTVPSGLTVLRIGASAGGVNPFSGHIRKLAYWPKRLTNTLLEQLTT